MTKTFSVGGGIGIAAALALLISLASVGFASAATPTNNFSGTGAGAGTITGSSINCTITAGVNSGTCSHDYEVNGPDETFTATQAIGSLFAGWSGAGCSGTGTCN